MTDFQELIEPIELIEPLGSAGLSGDPKATLECNKGYVCSVGKVTL